MGEGRVDDERQEMTSTESGTSDTDSQTNDSSRDGARVSSGVTTPSPSEPLAGTQVADGSTLRERRQLYKTKPSLRHVCDVIGLNEHSFVQGAQHVTQLEVFMTSHLDLRLLTHFPGLRTLRVIKQPDVRLIRGLEEAGRLEGLWVVDCALESTQGLEQCHALETLVLASNRIRSLENLYMLTKVQVLWLNDNRLTSLNGVECLVNLRTLWACRNRIRHLGSTFSRNVNLSDLNLADNLIGCFKEILSLCHLEKLKALTLTDPHFGTNPVCGLCNYQTLTLYHLTQLERLDMRQVSGKSKHISQSIFTKKSLFYSMRIRTLRRHAGDLAELAERILKSESQPLLNTAKQIAKRMRDCDRELDAAVCSGSSAPWSRGSDGSSDEVYGVNVVKGAGRLAEEELQEHKRMLVKLESIVENRLATMDNALNSTKEAIHDLTARMIDMLMMEFNTGGNIRQEEGTEADAWYVSFRGFACSAFHAKDFDGVKIQGIEVLRIVRLHHRLLRERFDAHIREVHRGLKPRQQQEGSPPLNRASNGTCSTSVERRSTGGARIEYLFLHATGSMPRESERNMLQIIEEGFQQRDEEPRMAIRLSATVWDADSERLGRHGAKEALDSCMTGPLLVVKMYRGRCMDVEMAEAEFQRLYGQGVPVTDYSGYHSLCIRTPERPGLKRWFMLDGGLVVPEAIVEYEYKPSSNTITSSLTLDERLAQLWGGNALSAGTGTPTGLKLDAQDHVTDLRPLSLPVLRFRSKLEQLLASYARTYQAEQESALKRIGDLRHTTYSPINDITEAKLYAHTRVKTLAALTRLNLHAQGIIKMENLSSCTQLKILVMSFNNISVMEGLSQLHSLTSLDLSYNRIRRLEGLDGVSSLTRLSLQGNVVEKLDDALCVANMLPELTQLDLRHNPLSRSRQCRTRMLRAFASLRVFNGAAVSTGERAEVSQHTRCLSLEHIRKAAFRSRQLPQLFGLSVSTTAPVDGRSRPTGVQLCSGDAAPGNRPDGANNGPSAEAWTSHVQDLYIDADGLDRLQHLDKLPHLRRASFAHNDLTSMDGVGGCAALEELSLENNRITCISHLDKCVRLRRLDLGSNALTELHGLEALTNLTQLSFEKNEVSSLAGLECLASLMELYAANNLIAHLAELDAIRHLSKLIILDLSGNPLALSEQYRIYTIFRIRWLKVLDGRPVSSREIDESHQVYQGKLTYETLKEEVHCSSISELQNKQGQRIELLCVHGGDFYLCMQRLDLSACDLKDVEILGAGDLDKLTDLTLDDNCISSFSWIKGLPSIVHLSLKRNRIESYASVATQFQGTTSTSNSTMDAFLPHATFCTTLEALHLTGNRVLDLRDLELHQFPNLTDLQCARNDISQLSGLQSCSGLRELVLDQNRIRQFDTQSLCGLVCLRELSVEDNGLRSIANLSRLASLQMLRLGNNRICDLSELERLREGGIHHLLHIRLNGNPVCRKPRYKIALLLALPSLVQIDGKVISQEERERAVSLSSDVYASRRGLAGNDPQCQPQNKTVVRLTQLHLGAAPSMRYSPPPSCVFPRTDALRGVQLSPFDPYMSAPANRKVPPRVGRRASVE